MEGWSGEGEGEGRARVRRQRGPVQQRLESGGERHGLRLSLVAGAALQCFGGWLRYLGTVLLHDWGFTVLLLGQGLAGLAQPVFTNAPAKLAGEWFPSSERELATVVGAPQGSSSGDYQRPSSGESPFEELEARNRGHLNSV